ncbi:hypothetical protein Xszus_02134 [Xenorhabdus szentirmaii]|nr:hypothetical protein Xszus_02134 [Xenorhabdus szentirmaii]
MTKQEIKEYLNTDLPMSDEDCIEVIQGDIAFILERGGFQGIKEEDVTVKIYA